MDADSEALQDKIRMLYKRYPVNPDHELSVWEKWVTIRKEESINLGKRTMRPPTDLAMHLLEKVRRDKERKTALEHAQIEEKVSFRGNLWEQPNRLKQHCYCQPVYEFQRTQAELGRPGIIEHVAVPNYIKVTEKGLIGEAQRKACPTLNAEYKKYRKRRENELKDKIKEINPFAPKMEELVVIGTKPKPCPKPLPKIPVVHVTAPEDPAKYALCGVYALKINNTLVFKDIPGQTIPHLQKMQQESCHENCYSWTYYFNVPLGRVGRGKLYLQNLGTVTLRYCWKRIKRPIPYIQETPYQQVFFFNKNEDVLAPGQSKELNFSFISDKPGIFNEFWEISMCNIFFFDALGTKLIVNLYADSIENIEQKSMDIDKLLLDIDRKAVQMMIENMLDDAIDEATTIQPMIYPYRKFFLEAELFIMKNPVCFYHQSDVLKMKEKYTEMCGEDWDLSIASWRDVMIGKDFDDRMTCYEFLKQTHGNLMKPWYEGNGLLNEKYRAVKLLLGQLADKFYDEFIRISEINGVSREPVDSRMSKVFDAAALIYDPSTEQRIRNIYYVYMFQHVANTIELCAGVLSSLDLNRWIEFDFCHFY